MPAREVIEIDTADGRTVVAEHVPPPEGEPIRGAVWLAHAMLANRRSLDRPAGSGLASVVAAEGLHAYIVDLRGHGAARGSNGRLQWTYQDILRFDLPAVTAAIRHRHPDLPLGAVGHSLSAHAAVAWLGIEASRGGAPVDAVVTIGANVWVRGIESSRARWVRKLAALGALVTLGRVCGGIPARALRVGSDDAPYSFIREWITWARQDRWGAADGPDYFKLAGGIKVPVLAVFGAGDRTICDPDCGRRFHSHLRSAAVDIHVANAEECGFDPGHMGLVTDPRCRPLWIRIARWLGTTLAKSERAAPGGARGRH